MFHFDNQSPRITAAMNEQAINVALAAMNIYQLEKELRVHEAYLLDERISAAEKARVTAIKNQIQAAQRQKLPDHTTLMTQIDKYALTAEANDPLLTTAKQIAHSFKYDLTVSGETTLQAATRVLADNSAENRDAVLTLIDENRKNSFKKGAFVIGLLTAFVGAAMIAAGIAMATTGVGTLAGLFLTFFGTGLLVGGITACLINGKRSSSSGSEENLLVNFGDSMIAAANKTTPNASTAKIGVFSTKKESVQNIPAGEYELKNVTI